MTKLMLSQDLKTAYENGKKVFENAHFEYAQMENWILEGVTFRNCKFRFSSFRNSSIKNFRFINCDFFFQSFFGADLDSVMFENCKLDVIRMGSVHFNKTVFRKCSLSYVEVTNTNRGAVDLTDSSQFRVIFNVSEVTDEVLAEAIHHVIPFLGDLHDLGIKTRIKELMVNVSREYGKEQNVNEASNSTSYEKTPGAYKGQSAYGKFSGAFDGIIDAYANMNKAKKDAYGKKDNYER